MSDETRLILEELGKLGPRLDSLGGKIDIEVSRLEAKIEAEVGRLEAKIEAEVGRLEEKMQLENEISPNIRRVAEGHLSLSRHLYEVMRPSGEVEMLSIRVGILENQVKRLEKKIS